MIGGDHDYCPIAPAGTPMDATTTTLKRAKAQHDREQLKIKRAKFELCELEKDISQGQMQVDEYVTVNECLESQMHENNENIKKQEEHLTMLADKSRRTERRVQDLQQQVAKVSVC